MAGEIKRGDSPAFPAKNDWHTDGGITIREHLAGLAMQGLLAGNYSYFDGNANIPVSKELVTHALQMADELLKQLE